jgi:hypothetical protein
MRVTSPVNLIESAARRVAVIVALGAARVLVGLRPRDFLLDGIYKWGVRQTAST